MALVIKKITCTLHKTRPEPTKREMGVLAPKAMDIVTQQKFENALGPGLEGVEIFTNPQIDAWLDTLHADAAAVGPRIFVRDGQYDLETRAGQGLMAHELTHVAQERRTTASDADRDQRELQALQNEMLVRGGRPAHPGIQGCPPDLEPGTGNSAAALHLAAKDRPFFIKTDDGLSAADSIAVVWEHGATMTVSQHELEQAFVLAAKMITDRQHEFEEPCAGS